MSEVCSPIHRCFPPQPTVCAICGGTDKAGCVLDRSDPPIITYLRERLALAEAETNTYEGRPIATLVGRGITKTLGVRGEKVGENPDGSSVYLFDEQQVRRVLAKWDAAVAVRD